MHWLEKIAYDDNRTYLEKVAEIVDAFAEGAVDGETADAIAINAGIDPADTEAVYNLFYGDLDKTASDPVDELVKVASDPYSTYLDKCAAVGYAYLTDSLDDIEAAEVVNELGLHPGDVGAVMEKLAEEADFSSGEKDKKLLERAWEQAKAAGRGARKFSGIDDFIDVGKAFKKGGGGWKAAGKSAAKGAGKMGLLAAAGYGGYRAYDDYRDGR